MSRNVFIVAAKRTPFGAFGKSLKDYSPTELMTHAFKAAITSTTADASMVDTVIVGNVQQTNSDTIYLSRHAGLNAGVDIDTPCLTVNRLCGSGFQAVVSGCHDIFMGDAEVALVGGAESMSSAPFVLRNVRWGGLGLQTSYPPLIDTLWECLTDENAGPCPMAITAENVAELHGITREECDAYALRSQNSCEAAQSNGVFEAEIAPMALTKVARKGQTPKILSADEGPRHGSALPDLEKLPALFKKNGCVTAGNASGLSDGACGLLLASEEAVSKYDFTPLARVAGYAVKGVEPTHMGMGPVPAVQSLLADSASANGGTALTPGDLDRVEINEAFAAQYLAVEKVLGLERTVTNVYGGAIALGHPTGASGARITGHLAQQMGADKDLKWTLGSACIGGGQGIAVLLERV